MDPDTIQHLSVLGVTFIGSGGIIKWLLAERKALLDALAEANKRERELRDTRASELVSQAKLLSDTNLVVRDSLAGVTRALDDLEKAVERAAKSS